jgi:ribonucleoside-diphosphate reductase alpha chain
MKFVDHAGNFDIAKYRHAIGILITAMDILVDNSGYPTESIARNSHDYRPLGLGYANLGALLMSFGLPYDSDAGRDFAATLTAIMCGEAYLQSSKLAEKCPQIPSATPLTANVDRTGKFGVPDRPVGRGEGACPGYYVNREPFLDVIRMHRAEVNNIGKSRTSAEPFVTPQLKELIDASRDCWDLALAHGEKHGYRNSQVTVLAPTGTIGFMMDCDTTGIEPDLALVKYKKLVGGGMIKIVNNTVPAALFKLGYSHDQVDAIVSYIDATGTIEGAPGVKPEHLACFDCSFKPSKGTRSIHYTGHVKMMAATQPFLSGAISKTVNLPHDCSLEDIADAYLDAWRLGLKAVAVYRDGSKGAQPLNVSDGKGAKEIKGTKEAGPIDALNQAADRVLASLVQGKPGADADMKTLEAKLSEKLEVTSRSILAAANAFQSALENAVIVSEAERSEAKWKDLRFGDAGSSTPSDSPSAQEQDTNSPPRAVRHRLPEERASLTHKFSLGGHEGYITVGLYPSGEPGEIFIKMAKEGSTVSGLMDSFATAISLSLQHGVPLKVLCEKFAHTRFEPSGWTGNEHIGYAKSIMDYIFRWLQLRFLSGQQLSLFTGLGAPAASPEPGPTNNSIILSEAERNEAQSKDPRFGDLGAAITADQHQPTRGMGATDSPRGGIAPSKEAAPYSLSPVPSAKVEDRGLTGVPGGRSVPGGVVHHAADAMRSMYDMGDAPSCHTCGAIMVRNGSCYRCMSCGSTSGCS